MDSYYFLDLEIKYITEEAEENSYDLSEYAEMYPDGNWEVGSDDIKIIYDDEEYDLITYDNKTKIIKFITNTDNQPIINSYKLTLQKV